MRFLPRSFQRRLALLFGSIALIVGVPTVIYVNQVYSGQLIADREEAHRDLAIAVATVLSENLRERQREVEYLAETPIFREEPLGNSKFTTSLDGLKKSHPYYSWIGFADTTGTVRAATGSLLVGQSVTQRPWFISGLKHRFVGDLHEALLLAKHLPQELGTGPIRFIDFAAPVLDNEGKVRGVVAAHAHWGWAKGALQAMIPKSAAEHSLDVFIVNKNNQVLYQAGFDTLEASSRAPNAYGLAIDSLHSDTNYVTASAPIAEVTPDNPLGWRIVVRQPKEVALKEVVAIRRLLVVAAVLAAAIFLGLAWWSATLVSRPLRRLAVLARKIEQGEEHAVLDVPITTTELQQLVEAVRGMASTLIRRKQALEDSNAMLEQRVKDRTAELERLNDELHTLARRDAMTTLANRLAANECLRGEFIRMKRTGVAYSILLIDIDFFKRINDTFGHVTGDQVLRHVAAVLKSSLRETDFVARFGGEEFIVLLPDTGIDDARMVGEKIRQGIESSSSGEVEGVTVSIGAAKANPEQTDEDEAVRQADEKLYQAKHAGRNQVAF